MKFANKKGLPFLAWNSAHGAIIILENMTNGIQIYLDQLSSVEIAEDGKTGLSPLAVESTPSWSETRSNY